MIYLFFDIIVLGVIMINILLYISFGLILGSYIIYILMIVFNNKKITDSNGFDVTKDIFYSYEETKSVLFTLATASVWIGLLNAIQEVCREKVILFKEYMSDLRVSAYISSKVVYFMILGLIQSLLLIGTFVLVVDVPPSGIQFPWFVECSIVIFLTILSGALFLSMGKRRNELIKNGSNSRKVLEFYSVDFLSKNKKMGGFL
mgnify:CR=1 FL=1